MSTSFVIHLTFATVLNDKVTYFVVIHKPLVTDKFWTCGFLLTCINYIIPGIKKLYGIDVSEKAIDILKADHGNYHAKVIEGFDYNVFHNQSFDLAYHFAVFGEIPREEYDQFFHAIAKLKPKFYMFVEGISPDGYKVVPKSFKKALELKNKVISTRNR